MSYVARLMDRIKEHVLKAFRKKHSSLWPAMREGAIPSDPLANWCSAQGEYRRRGILSQERIRLLEALGFEWDPIESLWMRRYRFLLPFRKKHSGKKPAS